jgi:hypothetical protein
MVHVATPEHYWFGCKAVQIKTAWTEFRIWIMLYSSSFYEVLYSNSCFNTSCSLLFFSITSWLSSTPKYQFLLWERRRTVMLLRLLLLDVQEVDRGTLDVQKVDYDGFQEVDRGKLDV